MCIDYLKKDKKADTSGWYELRCRSGSETTALISMKTEDPIRMQIRDLKLGFPAGTDPDITRADECMSLGYEPEGLKIYLFGEIVDMRKQMNWLSALVEGTYHMDPLEKVLFLFTNKKKDKIKALKWDENGFDAYNPIVVIRLS